MDSAVLPSMTLTELNNLVIKLKKPARVTKAQITQKLIRKLKKMHEQKKDLSKNKRKIEAIQKEIEVLKKVHLTVLITFSLYNKYTLNEVSKYSSPVVNLFARFCCHKLMANEISKWRKEHADWEKLGNYWRNHVSQRKKKPLPGRDILLLVEKVLLGNKLMAGSSDKIAERQYLMAGKKEGSEDEESLKNCESHKDENANDCDESSNVIKCTKIVNKKKIVNELIKVNPAKGNDMKNVEVIDKSNNDLVKKKQKNYLADESVIKEVMNKNKDNYDSKHGIKRFVMDELEEDVMNIEEQNSNEITNNIKSNHKKVSSMFEGGEDDEDEDIEEDYQNNDKAFNKNVKQFVSKNKPFANKSKKNPQNTFNQQKNKTSNKNEKVKNEIKANDDKDLHPSWLAKKKQKLLQGSTFEGKKIVFD